MSFLALCSPSPGADLAEFARRPPQEAGVLRSHPATGVLVEAWSQGVPGAVLVFDVVDREAAVDVAAALPLGVARLITTQSIELHPVEL